MQKVILGVVGVGLVVVGGWYVIGQSGDTSAMKAEEVAMEEKMKMEEAAMMGDEAMQKDMMKAGVQKMEGEVMMDDAMKAEEAAMMKDKGVYAPYDTSKLAMAASGDVVLFFKASWCPSCRALDTDIKANLEAIPGGVTILEVDYDTATALKQKYGVTTQHTLVQVDASGALIKKWSGGSTLASVVTQIQ